MAMAEVYYPEAMSTPGEEPSLVFPRAPPPSPEMPARGLGKIFEFPTSKLEGIGLDLRRDTFSFDEEGTEGNCLFPVGRKHCDGLFSDNDLYEEDYVASSPRKRVCCASSMALPEDRMITTFSSSSCDTSSLVSSGFGSFRDVSQREEENAAVGGVGLDGVMSNGVPVLGALSSGLRVQSKPHVIPSRQDESTVVMRDPFSPSYFTEEGYAQNMLSRSFDLYATHPHLPHSFETTQLPEVRPVRSRTLDTASLHNTLLPSPQVSEANLNPSQRRRKVSVKRKNPDDSESDPLQFSFDYSYSSTGSSGENDWVIVDRQPEVIWPLEKKPCSGDQSSVLASSMQQQKPYVFNNHSVFGNSQKSLAPHSITILPSFTTPLVKGDAQSQCDVEVNKDSTPIQRCGMEVELNPRNSEEQMDMEEESEGLQQNGVGSPLVLRQHPPGHLTATGDGQVPGLLAIPSRHSCMEAFLHQQSKSEGWWGSGKDSDQVLMDGETEARLSLSKSL